MLSECHYAEYCHAKSGKNKCCPNLLRAVFFSIAFPLPGTLKIAHLKASTLSQRRERFHKSYNAFRYINIYTFS
jgi:hypothetical protein